MGKELPILPASAQPAQAAPPEKVLYSRVFCQKESCPPLRLLIEFLKSRGQLPITPSEMEEASLDEWAWVHVTLGYDRARKPIQVFCFRDHGTYREAFEQEKTQFLEVLKCYDDFEASLVSESIQRARFILMTRFDQDDITEDGYDFNGWILEFYQEHCNGIVEVDGQGFYSPKGELIVDLSLTAETE
ncbi:hypothetical protein W02_20270 [Nitrospira sp. KM1]|uniref:hypothetical protein n=1 Tax=Nitrospira sp. KM1 TaxID=1936990 RepID=UPI0013A752F3|nr:hypothetical protein [Nitrospira sp. KM1]BCA54887.1 hypothetical protein W02_20270 [Nitrospira sp. KM1]